MIWILYSVVISIDLKHIDKSYSLLDSFNEVFPESLHQSPFSRI